MTPDQERALILARARLRLKEQETQNAPREDPTSLGNLIGAAVEPNMTLLSGMAAMPIAGVAGVASGLANAVGLPILSGMKPDEVVRKVQNSLTWDPVTTGGKNAISVIGAPFEKITAAVDEFGGKVSDVTGSPAVGAGVNAALNMLPFYIGGGGLKAIQAGPSTLKTAGGAASDYLMKSALKPSLRDALSGRADKAIKTMLDRGINVSRGGVEKLGKSLDDINTQIADAIVNSGETVNKASVAGRLHDPLERVSKQVSPQGDIRAVENAWESFSKHPLLDGVSEIPVPLAQELKQGTYRQLRNKYGEMGSADVEAQKALARGLKEEIAAKVPEVAPLNAAESEILNALKILERRAHTESNKNPLGLGVIAPSSLRLGAYLVDRSAVIKSLIARALNPGKNISISDKALSYGLAPQSFSEDAASRQSIIDELLRASGQSQ